MLISIKKCLLPVTITSSSSTELAVSACRVSAMCVRSVGNSTDARALIVTTPLDSVDSKSDAWAEILPYKLYELARK